MDEGAFFKKPVDRCYEFEDMVLHKPECPRYNGGTCYPVPVSPKGMRNKEEKNAVKQRKQIKSGKIQAISRVRPSGRSVNIHGEEI